MVSLLVTTKWIFVILLLQIYGAFFLLFIRPTKLSTSRRNADIFPKRCEGAPTLTFSYLLTYTIYITLTVRRMVRKPSQKIVWKIGQIIAIFFRRIDFHSRLLRPSLFLRNHECVHTWMQKDVGFYAFAAANQQVAGGVKIVREA